VIALRHIDVAKAVIMVRKEMCIFVRVMLNELVKRFSKNDLKVNNRKRLAFIP